MYPWLYDQPKSNPTSTKNSIGTWEFKANNSLMFYANSSVSEFNENKRADPRSIIYENTRFKNVIQFNKTAHPNIISDNSLLLIIINHFFKSKSDLGNMHDSKLIFLDPDSALVSPAKGSYKLVDSPPSTHHASETPSSSPNVQRFKSPSYAVPPTPLRESLAHKLASKSTKKRKSNLDPLDYNQSTPSSARFLSPAGKRLLSNANKSPFTSKFSKPPKK
ncbi:hypothetical protein AYI68_g2380 [Smittium mucronatum]|uniref:Uncharacterized protein n=1 Tax=Smittium mucronatum TaxID=133383 RepID=A0A1R0H2X5_9FUNG|nr:hypothetical protein AYI68_g2380 [Smittium mucronatum]